VTTERSGARSITATIVGYLLLGVIVLIVFHSIVGTILWLFRTIV